MRSFARDVLKARDLTIKRNTVAVVTDGSSVLGLGNIGPHAAIPVMEGKALLFREFARIDAWPLCLDTQDPDEIVETVRRIAPVFGGVNLEDIAAPRCFEIENRLQDLGIPVLHDDQHGTAIVLLAALINGAKVLDKELTRMKVVINGAGAAGTAIARLLRCVGHDRNVCEPVDDVIVCDSKGAIHPGRDDLSPYKRELLAYSNRKNRAGSLEDVLAGADVFVGVSRGKSARGWGCATNGPRPDRPGDGQSDTGDHARRSQEGRRGRRGYRPERFPEPGEQPARLPGNLSRRS